MIDSQKLTAGDKIMSQNEFAAIFKIGAPTVCRALNELTCEGVLYRVKGKGTFVAEKSVFGLASAVTPAGYANGNLQYTVGIYPFENYCGNNYLMGMAEGLTAGLIKNQVNCKYINRFELEHSKMSLLEYMFKHQIDGLIMTTMVGHAERRDIEEIRNNGFPHVLINRKIDGSDSVVCDHYAGTSELLNILIGMGHRKIAFIGYSTECEPVCTRRQAYRDVMLRNGLSAEERIVLDDSSDTGFNSRHIEFFKSNPGVSAVFVSLGSLQNKLLEALRENAINVPSQLSMVVFDEVRSKPEFGRITCAKQPLQAMGISAVDILVKKIRFHSPGQINLVYQAEIVHGDSCKVVSI